MKGPNLETEMVEDESDTTNEEVPPHLREEPPEEFFCLQIRNSECMVKRGPEKDNIIGRSEGLTYDFAMTPTEALIV
ncbi:uncharacterized protein LOC102576723 isoform X3 [Alligator mississippiensis]|uniref:uncharacterized protein LOC102576723 isoform X3 n=1 Tax=Alligator mississippiensis TaxID=8496 RepID=UPI00287730FC|nr:uncharacterized protein LOC102576723 isoform X3 [Alligator mississippiensis]